MCDDYRKDVETLRSLGREWNLSETEIEKVMDDSLKFLESDKREQNGSSLFSQRVLIVWRLLVAILIIIILLMCFMVHRKALQNIVERNVQEVIYPGMKLFRKMMLPVIKTFPSLTEWYDETCLVGNPYFQVSDLDCWPCGSVRNVLNLTGSDLSSDQYHSGIPFIYKEDGMRIVRFSDLKELYKNQKEMFDEHAPRVECSTGNWHTSEDLFSPRSPDVRPSKKRNSHLKWRLNRLDPIRSARQLFGSPKHSPHYTAGTAPEKFILIDEPRAPPYPLPPTEGSTVFVVQGSGSRLLVLDPAPECLSNCHRVSVLLQPQHILWYNWWYWRASSFPVLTNDRISVTYVGSYY